MAGVSPTQNTLKWLRKLGYTAAVVEKWNPHAKIRQDLFGFVDVLGVGPKGTMAVQSTSKSNMSSRIKKVRAHENLPAVMAAGWDVLVQGWAKEKNRWVPTNTFINQPEAL